MAAKPKMPAQRFEYGHSWYWDGKQDRYWYKQSYMVKYVIDGVDAPTVIPPREIQRVLGTVTRVADTRSPFFNRWFATLHTAGDNVNSEPMYTRDDAKAWLEVIERMNR